MEYKYDVAVFIGRFQPFHIGHKHVVDQALKVAERVIMVVGSTDAPRTPKNPFTYEERVKIIQSTVYQPSRVIFTDQPDHPYNDDRWLQSIQQKALTRSPAHPKIAIIGYNKDHSSRYLRMFPQWDLLEVQPAFKDLNATNVRNELFGDIPIQQPWAVSFQHAMVVTDIASKIHSAIREEMKVIADYKAGWINSPYPPTFNTVDAVVVQSAHILLVRRHAMPGKGLWALPGGFINQTETLKQATIRELREETRLAVPEPVLLGSIVKSKTYDDPDRSLRGRTITHATYFRLKDEPKLPKVKGADDADKALWLSLSRFAQMRNVMFEDHFSIVEDLVGI